MQLAQPVFVVLALYLPALQFVQTLTLDLYLPGPHCGVWNAEGLAEELANMPAGQRSVILCEALLDAMTFWVHGFKNVTASYGTGGFTEDHLALFKSLKVNQVRIAYDRDSAGDQAAEALAEQSKALGDSGEEDSD